MKVQRDFGDRTSRKHARLKYTIEDRGIAWFVSELETRLGFSLQPARPVPPSSTTETSSGGARATTDAGT